MQNLFWIFLKFPFSRLTFNMDSDSQVVVENTNLAEFLDYKEIQSELWQS